MGSTILIQRGTGGTQELSVKWNLNDVVTVGSSPKNDQVIPLLSPGKQTGILASTQIKDILAGVSFHLDSKPLFHVRFHVNTEGTLYNISSNAEKDGYTNVVYNYKDNTLTIMLPPDLVKQ